MGTLHTELWLARPLDAVFAFFSDARNLETITPPWLSFAVLTPPPITMRVGARIDYKLRLRGIPLKWQSEITAWEPPVRFVDEQRRGPYLEWRHEHRFEAKDGGTLVIDAVQYRAPGGAIVEKLFVRPDVERIFAFRQDKLKELFAGDTR